MSSVEQSLAHLANPEVQRQIASAGGSLPNLASAAAAAEKEALEATLKTAVSGAQSILQGANQQAANLVSEANALARSVTENQKKQDALARARTYFNATNNIYPLRKLIGMPTPKDILAQYPKIDEIPDNWNAPAAG